jgi:endoglucanase
LAEALTKLISSKAVKQLPGLGPMLLPAPKGFQLDRATYQLNPSYLPLQVVLGLAESNPRGPWRRMALGIPAVVRGGAPRGFMLDWVAYNSKDGFQPKPSPAGEPAGSFDAIRVYLWAGMLDHSTAGRAELLEALGGMRAYLIEHRAIPDRTSGDGKVISTRAGVGFAAALIPFAIASGELELAGELKKRLAAEFNTAVGLYGPEIRYYDQCLALFSTAWVENRYSFDPRGNLSLKWSQP